MEGLEAYPEEFVNSLKLSLEYYKRVNITFFGSKTSFWDKYRHFFVFGIPFAFFYYTVTMYMVKVVAEGLDPFAKPDMIALWLISTQVIFKYILFTKNKEGVRLVIEHLGAVWRMTDLTKEQILIKNSSLKFLKYGLYIYNKSCMTTAWQYFLYPFISMLFKHIFWGNEIEMVLPFPCEYPFAVDNWPVYLAVYALQIIGALQMVHLYLAPNFLLTNLSIHISTQFRLLQDDLINIKPTNNKKTKYQYDMEITKYYEGKEYTIEDFVRRHQDIILLTRQLNDAFNKMVFVNLVISTVVVCFFAVAVKTTIDPAYKLTNGAALVAYMANLLIVCYCSEMLSISSTGIALSAAKNMWYDGDLRYQKIICIIIMRSQKPCTLLALNYYSISMKTFNKALKTTYSYFSLASHIYDGRKERKYTTEY
uniref:Odorant receptor n=1 Tax=Ostrinia furnacalis TaxID=93504 RepID=A0A0E4B3V5_OSTFU|nr:putative olfactory receptor 19 [Ostrinia furnacalis]